MLWVWIFGLSGIGVESNVEIICRHSKSKTDDILLVQNSSRPRPVGLRYFFFWNDRQIILPQALITDRHEVEYKDAENYFGEW